MSFFHNMVRCGTNTAVMYVKRGLLNGLLFVKTHYYSNKQLIMHGKFNHNIFVCTKGDISLDNAKKQNKKNPKKTMKYNHNVFYKKGIFMTNYAFINVFVMGLDSAAIVIVEFQLRSVGDMGDQLAIRLRFMRPSSDLFALWTDRHGSLCKGVNRRRSWRSVRDNQFVVCCCCTHDDVIKWKHFPHLSWVKLRSHGRHAAADKFRRRE